jgi:mevalonate kinase
MSGQNSVDTATLVAGGWSAYHKLTPEDKAVFDEATKGFVGVTYTPQTVSTQVVAGVNYRFKCLASIPPAEVVWEAIVEIFKPLNGKPYITGIIRL